MVDIEAEVFQDYSIDEIKQGFIEDDKGYICLICGERFEKGQIYSFSDRLYEGKVAVKLHIKYKHQSVKDVLLNMNANNMGISDLQLQLLNFFAKGLSDKEIADYLGVAGSTIRNHRHKLRERERQNKLFISLMELLTEDGFVKNNIHMNKNDSIEENVLSDKERKRILDKYMTESGRLKAYPNYERSKKVILEAILVNFCMGTQYSEEEVNHILKSIYTDYKLLRHELIEYNYMDRTTTGAIYWVKNYSKPYENKTDFLSNHPQVVAECLEQIAK